MLKYAIFGSGLKVNIKNQIKFSFLSICRMTLSIRNTNLTQNMGAVAVLSCVFWCCCFCVCLFFNINATNEGTNGKNTKETADPNPKITIDLPCNQGCTIKF